MPVLFSHISMIIILYSYVARKSLLDLCGVVKAVKIKITRNKVQSSHLTIKPKVKLRDEVGLHRRVGSIGRLCIL